MFLYLYSITNFCSIFSHSLFCTFIIIPQLKKLLGTFIINKCFDPHSKDADNCSFFVRVISNILKRICLQLPLGNSAIELLV